MVDKEEPRELLERLSGEFETRKKALRKDFIKKAGDPTIVTDGVVMVRGPIAGEPISEKFLAELRAVKQLWRLKDGQGRRFYTLGNPHELGVKGRTDLRDRIFQQQAEWEALPPEQRGRIETAYEPFGPMQPNAYPYQDFLNSQALGKIFTQAKPDPLH